MKYLLIILFSWSSFLMAQDETIKIKRTPVETKKWKSAGINAGGTTGFGITYKVRSNREAIQFTALPIVTADFSVVSLGAKYEHYIKPIDKYTEMYYYVGNHTLPFSDDLFNSSTNNDMVLNFGVGLGINYELEKLVHFNFAVGYGLYDVINGLSGAYTGEIGVLLNIVHP